MYRITWVTKIQILNFNTWYFILNEFIQKETPSWTCQLLAVSSCVPSSFSKNFNPEYVKCSVGSTRNNASSDVTVLSQLLISSKTMVLKSDKLWRDVFSLMILVTNAKNLDKLKTFKYGETWSLGTVFECQVDEESSRAAGRHNYWKSLATAAFRDWRIIADCYVTALLVS